MLTPKDVQDKKFSKAVFGGYDMTEVDDFLDQLGGDYEKLVRDSATLKSKLKALAQKVDEYRTVDEELRKTLATAKRNSDEQVAAAQREREETVAHAKSDSERTIANARIEAERIVADARARADDMVIEARAKAENRLATLKKEFLDEQERYAKAREQIREYAAVATSACRKQAELLQIIANVPPLNADAPSQPSTADARNSKPQSVPAVAETPREHEQKRDEIKPAPAVQVPPSAAEAERITERYERPADAVPQMSTPGQINLGGVTVNVTSLDLNANAVEVDEEEAFRDIFN